MTESLDVGDVYDMLSEEEAGGVNKMAKDTWMIGRNRSSGDVFGSKYQPKAYNPVRMKWYKYVVAALAFSLGIWMLLYILGGAGVI